LGDRQKIPGCRQIVTKNGAKWAKTKQMQKIEILAISRLAKGFN
jgi:hypothetical protein